MKKIFAGIMMLAAVAFTSCQEWLDVNNNIDAPDYVESHLYLSGVIQEFWNYFYDADVASAGFTRMMSGSSNFAAHTYTQSNDAAGAMWRMTYWQQGMNLENLIKQAEAAEQWTMAGIGYAIKAFSWASLWAGTTIVTLG